MIKATLIYPFEFSASKDRGLKKLHLVLDRLESIGINTIFVMVKHLDGRVYYESDIAEKAPSYFEKNTPKYEWDFLDHVIENAHKRNMKVFAWFCTFIEGYIGKMGGKGASNFIKTHPELAAVDSKFQNTLKKPIICDYGYENWLCPINPKTWQYEHALVKELVLNYDLDGFHLDFIRFPSLSYCYCNYCTREFKKDHPNQEILSRNNPIWINWRMNKLNAFVEMTYDKIKKDIPLSALVWLYPDCLRFLQNWKNWKIDIIVPMLFHKAYWKNIKWIEKKLDDILSIKRDREVYAGVGGPFSNTFTKKQWLKIEKIIENLGVDGILFLHYGINDFIMPFFYMKANIEAKLKDIVYNIYKIARYSFKLIFNTKQ